MAFSLDSESPIQVIHHIMCSGCPDGHGLLMQGIRQRHADRLRAVFIRSPWLLKLIIFAIVIQMVVNLSQDNVRPFIYAQF